MSKIIGQLRDITYKPNLVKPDHFTVRPAVLAVQQLYGRQALKVKVEFFIQLTSDPAFFSVPFVYGGGNERVEPQALNKHRGITYSIAVVK